MRALPRKYAEFVVRWPWVVLIASLILVIGLGCFAARQRYYNPYDMWFLPDDPAVLDYRRLVRQYGPDDFVVVAFRDPAGIFTNRALDALLDLTDRLEKTGLVDRVSSITNYQYIDARQNRGGEEELLIEDLIQREGMPLSLDTLAARQRIALGEKGVVGTLLGPPAGAGQPVTTAAAVARVLTQDQWDSAVLVVERIRQVASEIERKYGYQLYLAGVPVVEHAFATFGRREALTFSSILVGVVVLLLWLLFRRVMGTVLPVAVVVLAVAPALGVMALFGVWLNALTTIIPQILLTVGIAEVIHVVAHFFERRAAGLDRASAVIHSVEATFSPCLITSVTTMVGFASLMTTTVVPMRGLGLGATLGVLFAWVLTFTLVPASLALWPARRADSSRLVQGGGSAPDERFGRAMDWLAALVTPRPWPVIAAMLGLFAILMVFALDVRVETSYKNMFKPQTELRQGLAFIEEHLGGTEDVEISVDSGRPDGVKDPAFLRTLQGIQADLAAQPGMSSTLSILDILERMNQAMHGNDPSAYRIPASAEIAAQYLLLYTLGSRREDLKDRIDVDSRWTRVSGRMRAQTSSDTLLMGARLRQLIKEKYPDVGAYVTGKALLYTRLQEEMASNTINAFLTAAVPIAAVQALLFWSLKIGFLSMVPNLLPIAAMVGLMGLMGIPLDPGSAMVASVAIGIVVDDTVHFFSRYFKERGRGVQPGEAARLTLREVGRPVIYTTVILVLGFSLFAFSQFNFIAYFGQLAACVVLLALAVDLLMTPALLVGFDRGRRGTSDRRRRLPRAAAGAVLAAGLALAPAGTAAGPAEERGSAIMKEQDRINRGFQSESTLFKMTLVNANGDRSERSMELRLLEKSGSQGDKTIIVFKAPPDINGTGLLTYQNPTGEDDQWLYLPALRRVRRIASANRSSSFVGSEFTYEDLTPLDIGRYAYKYLRDDAVGAAKVWVVESVPQFKDSGYSRAELFVSPESHQTLRTNYYDRKGELLKVGTFENWSQIDGKWWRARTVRMENAQTKKSTLLETHQIKLGAGLAASDFTTRALER